MSKERNIKLYDAYLGSTWAMKTLLEKGMDRIKDLKEEGKDNPDLVHIYDELLKHGERFINDITD